MSRRPWSFFVEAILNVDICHAAPRYGQHQFQTLNLIPKRHGKAFCSWNPSNEPKAGKTSSIFQLCKLLSVLLIIQDVKCLARDTDTREYCIYSVKPMRSPPNSMTQMMRVSDLRSIIMFAFHLFYAFFPAAPRLQAILGLNWNPIFFLIISHTRYYVVNPHYTLRSTILLSWHKAAFEFDSSCSLNL